MEIQKGALKVALFRGAPNDATASNSLVIERDEIDVNFLASRVFIRDGELVFCSQDKTLEILHLNLKKLLKEEYDRTRREVVGLSVDERIELALAIRDTIKAKSKEHGGVKWGVGLDDWRALFDIISHPHPYKGYEDAMRLNINNSQ